MLPLPTAVFLYGMESGQEINIDLERGKTLIVRAERGGVIREILARSGLQVDTKDLLIVLE